MTLSISLSREAETRLRERAAAAGKDPSDYASEIVESAVSAPSAEQAAGALTPDEQGEPLDQVLAGFLERASKIRKADTSRESHESAYELFAPILEEARQLQRSPDAPNLKGTGAEFAEGVAEDLRRQGLKA